MKKQAIIIVSLCLVLAAFVTTTIILFVRTADLQKKLDAASATEQATPDSPPATPDTSAATEAQGASYVPQETADISETAPGATAPEISVPEEMEAVLQTSGYTAGQLYESGCRQLVTVSSLDSSAAVIRFYYFADNVWKADENLTCQGYVGRNGVTTDMYEGGQATPFGMYPIGDAFYIYSKPETGLNTFEITENTYWVDDPDSSHYNRRVEGVEDKDWNSAEHMIDYASNYEYGFVINYNTAAAYNKGSAIFFHISDYPTAGCVATSRDMVLSYLASLDASQNPCIVIV